MVADRWTFPWQDTLDVLSEQQSEHPLILDERRRCFQAPGICITPPLIFPIHPEVDSLSDYLACLPATPTRHFVILLQAGAAALGVFERGEKVVTKSDKKYVVRGRGHAQPTHLASKGKSRYGSRLRLQNARLLLDGVSTRLRDWVDEYGPPAEIFYSATVRLWTALLTHTDSPAFSENGRATKIPHDLPIPTTDVLLRTYRKMSFGRVDFPKPS